MVMFLSLLTLSACGTNSGKSGETQGTAVSGAGKNGPLTKYDPPVEVTFVRTVIELTEADLAKSNYTIEDNDWTRTYLDDWV